MTPAAPRFLSAASSDQGLVRSNNEDRVYCDDLRGIFLVVDGMGGHEAGEQAAEIAVERIRARLERQTGSIEQRLREAITLANNAIYETAQTTPGWNGMACVLTAAIIEDGVVYAGHVGDSRLYQVKRGGITKLTHDHSPVGEREDSGDLSEAEAMRHPRRNEVYRDVGSLERAPEDDDFIELLQFPFEPDSALLLCSDGLSDAVSSAGMLRIIEEHAGDRWTMVRALIAAANEAGKDNVSVVWIEGKEFAPLFGRRSVPEPSRSGNLDSSTGEQTGRLTARAASVRWYESRWAYLFYGLLLGALLVLLARGFAGSGKATSSAQVLIVTAPGTIADALNRAHAGDTVSVGPGTYPEPVHMKEGVELIAQPAHEAILKGPVIAEGIERGRLEGFQVQGGETGISINNSDVVLARNEVSGATKAGIAFSGTSRGAIAACNIHHNTGAGIILTDTASPFIESNLILNNGTQPGALKPGLWVRSPVAPFLTSNIFVGNGAEAVWLPAAGPAVTQLNYFTLPVGLDRKAKFRIVAPGSDKP